MTNTQLVSNEVQPYILNFISQQMAHTKYQIIPLAGDASNRTYYRIALEETSFVLMVWEPFEDPNSYPFLSVLNHFKKFGVHVPKVQAISPKEGLVLLEDLGDLTLERKFYESQKQESILPFYKQAIDELIKIHFLATDNFDPKVTCFNIQFDEAKFLWEMNYGKTHLIDTLCELKLTELESKALQQDFIDICQKLDREPKRISHRDYHSRNLMLKLGKMRVIDFQDARLGPIQYDIVSLLCDSYVDLDDNITRQLITYYLERAKAEHHLTLSHDEFMSIYHTQSLQRCFKACGSFASFYNLREDRRYLHYIHPTLVRLVNILENNNSYKTFLQLLTDKGLLETDYEAL